MKNTVFKKIIKSDDYLIPDWKPAPRCRYAFIREDGEFMLNSNTACHAGFSYPGGNFNVEMRDVAGFVNWVWGDVNDLWWKYAFDPKVSPWRKQLTEPFHTFVRKDGKVRGSLVTDMTQSSQFLCNFAKIGRVYTEYAGFGKTMNHLIENGVHPGIAMFVSQRCEYGTKKTAVKLYGVGSGWHGSFMMNSARNGIESLRHFLAGEHNQQKWEPYTKAHNYYGVDSIWDYTSKDGEAGDIITYLKKKYADCFGDEEKAAGRFAVVNLGGVTPDNLTKACLRLQEDMKVEPYV